MPHRNAIGAGENFTSHDGHRTLRPTKDQPTTEFDNGGQYVSASQRRGPSAPASLVCRTNCVQFNALRAEICGFRSLWPTPHFRQASGSRVEPGYHVVRRRARGPPTIAGDVRSEIGGGTAPTRSKGDAKLFCLVTIAPAGSECAR